MLLIPPPPKNDDKDVKFDWFLRVRNGLNSLASTEHNTLQAVQGGSATEKYHLTASKYNAIQSGISAIITTAKLTPGGVDGVLVFTNGILTSHTQAT